METAAEIYDLCQEDIISYVSKMLPSSARISGADLSSIAKYPKVCRKDVSISVIQSRSHILNTVSFFLHSGRFIQFNHVHCMLQYSEAISKFAEDKFLHDGIDLITNARVSAVTPDHVVYTTKNAEGKPETHEIPSNFVLWSTGIAMNPFVARVSSLL